METSKRYTADAQVIAICAALSRAPAEPMHVDTALVRTTKSWPDRSSYLAALDRAVAAGFVERLGDDRICLSADAAPVNWTALERPRGSA